MGACSSSSKQAIPPTRLTVALSGGAIRSDDYLGQSANILDNLSKIAPSVPVRGKKTDCIDIESAYTLLEPGYTSLEDGYARLGDGTLYIAVYTELGDVDGEMFDWWFSNVENTDRYRWSHPDSHISATWDATFYSVRPHERKPGHYVGHTLYTKTKIGKKVRNINYVFIRPSRYFNTRDLEDARVSACICARIHVEDPPFGFIAVGYLIHIVRKTPDGKNELRTRFWLGDVHQDEEGFKFIAARFINTLGNWSLVRTIRMGSSLGKSVYENCYEEMTCLKKFLPHFYSSELLKYKTII